MASRRKPSTIDAEATAVPQMTEPLVREITVTGLRGAKPAFELTDAGREFAKWMASRGMSRAETSRAMGMPQHWLERQIKQHEDLDALWHQGDAEGLAALRAAGFEMAMINPAQNQFERKVRAGEGIQREVDVNHKIHVVGTLPVDSSYSTEEWLEQFAPERLEHDDHSRDH